MQSVGLDEMGHLCIAIARRTTGALVSEPTKFSELNSLRFSPIATRTLRAIRIRKKQKPKTQSVFDLAAMTESLSTHLK